MSDTRIVNYRTPAKFHGITPSLVPPFRDRKFMCNLQRPNLRMLPSRAYEKHISFQQRCGVVVPSKKSPPEEASLNGYALLHRIAIALSGY